MIVATVKEPFYDFGGRKYIVVTLDTKDIYPFTTKDKNVDNPSLVGNDLRIKVPFRYNRPTCKVVGITPVRELERGDKVEIELQYTGVWEVQNKTGTTWKLNSIEDVSPPR